MGHVITSDSEIRSLLLSTRSIAVVGLSENQSRPSFGVASYLVGVGYEVIPVNPNLEDWQGIRAFPTLVEIGRPVDLVDVFRRPEFLPDTVDDAIAARSGTMWTQLEVINDEATDRAVAAGMNVVIDRCTYIEHSRLVARQGRHS